MRPQSPKIVQPTYSPTLKHMRLYRPFYVQMIMCSSLASVGQLLGWYVSNSLHFHTNIDDVLFLISNVFYSHTQSKWILHVKFVSNHYFAFLVIWLQEWFLIFVISLFGLIGFHMRTQRNFIAFCLNRLCSVFLQSSMARIIDWKQSSQ